MPTRPGGKNAPRGGPRPLPPDYVGLPQVCKDLGITSPNAFSMRRLRDPDSVPPMIKVGGNRLGIKREDYAAWIRARHLDTVRELTQRAAELRREAAELEQEASQALVRGSLDAAAS